MQFCLVLMCVWVLLSLYPVIRGNDDFSGNGNLDDMVSFASNHIMVYKTIPVSPSNQLSTIDSKIDDQTDDINILTRSIEDVVKMLNKLNTNVDHILQTENIQSSPKNNIDFMDSLEISNKVNNIYQYITSSSPESLDPYQLPNIRHSITAIANANKSLRNFNQVLARTMQAFNEVTNMVQFIDKRTQNYRDWTSSNSMNNQPCKKARSRRLNTNRVHIERNISNCHDLKKRQNGVYKFASQQETANKVGRFFHERYCEFDTDGPAWTVIQRRNNNQENFNRTWQDYKLGFGQLHKEFWFGNEFIHKLTTDEDMELRIVLEDNTGQQNWVQYSSFKVYGENLNYKLHIGGYNGSISKDFMCHNDRDNNDQGFSTYDRNDNNDMSCASSYGHGWWFDKCIESNRDYKGIMWENWLSNNFLKSSKMMIRPNNV